jgi:hypothetical protein
MTLNGHALLAAGWLAGWLPPVKKERPYSHKKQVYDGLATLLLYFQVENSTTHIDSRRICVCSLVYKPTATVGTRTSSSSSCD